MIFDQSLKSAKDYLFHLNLNRELIEGILSLEQKKDFNLILNKIDSLPLNPTSNSLRKKIVTSVYCQIIALTNKAGNSPKRYTFPKEATPYIDQSSCKKGFGRIKIFHKEEAALNIKSNFFTDIVPIVQKINLSSR